jgi:hypothetical protein
MLSKALVAKPAVGFDLHAHCGLVSAIRPITRPAALRGGWRARRRWRRASVSRARRGSAGQGRPQKINRHQRDEDLVHGRLHQKGALMLTRTVGGDRRSIMGRVRKSKPNRIEFGICNVSSHAPTRNTEDLPFSRVAGTVGFQKSRYPGSHPVRPAASLPRGVSGMQAFGLSPPTCGNAVTDVCVFAAGLRPQPAGATISSASPLQRISGCGTMGALLTISYPRRR